MAIMTMAETVQKCVARYEQYDRVTGEKYYYCTMLQNKCVGESCSQLLQNQKKVKR